MKATPLTGALGAEISGLDLNQITSDQVCTLDEYFHQHLVLVFRDQRLDPQDLLNLTQNLADPEKRRTSLGFRNIQMLCRLLKRPQSSPRSASAQGGIQISHSKQCPQPNPASGKRNTARGRRHFVCESLQSL